MSYAQLKQKVMKLHCSKKSELMGMLMVDFIQSKYMENPRDQLVYLILKIGDMELMKRCGVDPEEVQE